MTTLDTLLRAYATDPSEYSTLLEGITPANLRSVFTDLLKRYLQDVNLSTLRERVTLLIGGYEPSEEKLGYNGLRGDVKVEVKPVNIRSHDQDKLNGGGNFSDLTPEHLDKYKAEGANFRLLVSGFVDGQIVYALEFPFLCANFVAHLQGLLRKRWPKRKRRPGEYLRSASFSFRHYRDCPDLQVVWVTQRLNDYQRFLTRDLYHFLLQTQRGKP